MTNTKSTKIKGKLGTMEVRPLIRSPYQVLTSPLARCSISKRFESAVVRHLVPDDDAYSQLVKEVAYWDLEEEHDDSRIAGIAGFTRREAAFVIASFLSAAETSGVGRTRYFRGGGSYTLLPTIGGLAYMRYSPQTSSWVLGLEDFGKRWAAGTRLFVRQ